jgi:putative hydrolase of the HAD superfamily
VLKSIHGVRAVLFDIYGTLLISASGDISVMEETAESDAFEAALATQDLRLRSSGEVGVQILMSEVTEQHTRARNAGKEYPEVDIVEVWQETLIRLVDAGDLESTDGSSHLDADLRRLALEYEMRVNPVWPMPHAQRCLDELHRAGLTLGLISNAQFFTIDLWRLLLEYEESEFVFDEELQYYSYQYGCAKPGVALYERAARDLEFRGIAPVEVLYVGNDMLNDIAAAHRAGFRTALFAGDGRSLRLRKGDHRVDDVTPDLVIFDLATLPECIVTTKEGN